MISFRSQVEVTGGAPGIKQPTTAGADTPSSGAAAGTRSHALVRALASLLLILFVANIALLVRAYVLYQRADSTTTTVIGSSNDLLIVLLNAETGQRGYLLTDTGEGKQVMDQTRIVTTDLQCAASTAATSAPLRQASRRLG